jgi:glyoxylase-like metal-dependent hydrolase (beta-lactamase superfamily II)
MKMTPPVNVFILDVCFHWNGRPQSLFPVILQKEKETLLVDGGYPGFLPLLENAAAVHGLSLTQLTGVLITHHDIDHMGALFELKEKYPAVTVYASQQDEPYVSGKKKSLRLQQAEALFPCLPEEQKESALQFMELLKSLRPVAVDQVLTEGELPFLEGVEVVHTPGHMPGHLSLYVKEEKTVIAADAVVREDGELNMANPSFTLDLPLAVRSVQKLRQMAIEKLVCYHGGVVEKDIQRGLDRIIETYSPQSPKEMV